MKQALIYFSGKVQGVGFRAYVLQHVINMVGDKVSSAKGKKESISFPLTGYVKNKEDGTVELLLEGEENAIRKTCQNIATGAMKDYIRHTDLRPFIDMEKRDYQDFSIRY